jgi:hypothetical protein
MGAKSLALLDTLFTGVVHRVWVSARCPLGLLKSMKCTSVCVCVVIAREKRSHNLNIIYLLCDALHLISHALQVAENCLKFFARFSHSSGGVCL